MPQAKRRRRRLIGGLLVAGFLSGLLLLWILSVVLPVRERTQPDHLHLGDWPVGARVEISARFLIGGQPSWLDNSLDSFTGQLPSPLKEWTQRIHPRTFRKARQRGIDLSRLRPVVTVPSGTELLSAQPLQDPNWNDQIPYVDVRLRLGTVHPGPVAGEVRVRLGRREASLPLSFTVRSGSRPGARRLIVDSPFNETSTESGKVFRETTALLSSLGGSTDVLEQLPEELSGYDVLLLADEGLVRLTMPERERVGRFVKRGGRLILSCNAFMVGSVQQANEFLVPNGLKVVDRDQIRQVAVTNIPQGGLTAGVGRLEFFRPSLVRISDPVRAHYLAANVDGDGGYAALARPLDGGEIVVLGVSLWWAWLNQFAATSDNAVLMKNLLEASPTVQAGK